MTIKNTIKGQKVSQQKVQQAKTLRRQQTPAEQALWQKLRRNQICGLHFRRQQLLSGFIVDFYCYSIGLIIEIDGDIHKLQTEHDAERQDILVSQGFTILRFKNEQVLTSIDDVVVAISEMCVERMRPET